MMELKKGQLAPNFEGIDEKGNKFNLSNNLGKKVALYFYPKDMTPGCTSQACNLRDNFSVLKSSGIEVVGVSPDALIRHQKFIEKYELPFTLITDPEKQIINLYGVWGPKKFMGKAYDGVHRTTFLIDEKGYILNIIEKPKVKIHAQEILDCFKNTLLL